jgi:hypothetical protein
VFCVSVALCLPLLRDEGIVMAARGVSSRFGEKSTAYVHGKPNITKL